MREPYVAADAAAPLAFSVGARAHSSRLLHGEWLTLTLTGALAMTVVDTLLIERRFGVFRGGFLATDHLETVWQKISFFAASMLADVVVVAALAAIALWICKRTRLSSVAIRFLAAALAVGPLVADDLISYQVLVYMGDAFDLRLMFDLVGGRPRELLAVASEHLVKPAGSAALTGIVVAAVAWCLHVRFPARPFASRARSLVRPVVVILLVAGGSAVVTAVRLQSQSVEQGLRRKPSARALAMLVNWTTDFDRDGYGLGFRPADPDPFNARIHPYALDLPGDGIDQNGLGGDLPPARAAYTESAARPGNWEWRPDVVVILLESVRADAIGAVVEGKPVTPVLDRLAAAGASAAMAVSHNGFTGQSRYHLLTGSLAGVREGTSLIDDFRANAYQVGYFSGQDDTFGEPELAVGFERADVFYDARSEPHRRYTRFSTPGSLAVPASVVQEHVARFLDGADRDRPLFLYVNFHDTHFPYHHDGIPPRVTSVVLKQSEIVPSRSDDLRSMYLNTVAAVDQATGDLLEAVARARGRAPAVIVTSDHGESLFDEGFLGHGYALNDAQTRVPFIAANLPLALAEPVAHVDVRDAIWRALAHRPAGDERPHFTRDPARTVAFQYLGSITHPRQIGLVSSEGRTAYDFRTGLVFSGSEWRRLDSLSAAETTAFLDLIRRWESMMLARARSRGEDSP